MTARSGRGVYSISVTSELTSIGPQTVRLYESRGLLIPARTDGGTRRYSDGDLARLQRITELLAVGVNLAASPTSSTWKPETPNSKPTTPT